MIGRNFANPNDITTRQALQAGKLCKSIFGRQAGTIWQAGKQARFGLYRQASFARASDHDDRILREAWFWPAFHSWNLVHLKLGHD